MMSPTPKKEEINRNNPGNRIIRPLHAPFIVIVFFIAWSGLGAEDGLFLLQGDTLHVLDSNNGSEIAQRPAPGADVLWGTPGGKYVFAMELETGRGEAVDFSDPESAKPVDLSSAAPLTGAVFSPMGDVLYGYHSETVTAHTHRAGELSDSRDFPIRSGSRGQLAFNTRGTRMYRSGPGGLIYVLISDRSIIKTVPAGGSDRDWVMAPGGRFLWGSGPEGWVVVDESRGRIAEEITTPGAAHLRFSPDGRGAWAMAENHRVLLSFDTRRHRVTGRVALPEAAVGPAVDGTGAAWIATSEGLYRTGPKDAAVQRIRDLPGTGAVKAFISVRLKPNQGFACF